ncbi:MAG: hypothetical protein ACKOW9_05120 [Candidatus Paceibacterota bacterium]
MGNKNNEPELPLHNPAQLKLTFKPPATIITVTMALNGVFVYLKSDNREAALVIFASIGVPLEVSSAGPIRFNIKYLKELTNLPENVTKNFAGDLNTLWELCVTRPETVVIQREFKDVYNVKWSTSKMQYNESISRDTLPALLSLGVKYVARDDVQNEFEKMGLNSNTFYNIEYNIDRYYTLQHPTPPKALLDSGCIVFRINSNTYGIPITECREYVAKGILRTNYTNERSYLNTKMSNFKSSEFGLDLKTISKIENLVNGPGGLIITSKEEIKKRTLALMIASSASAEQVIVLCDPKTLSLWNILLKSLRKSFCIRDKQSCTHSIKLLLYSDFLQLKYQVENIILDSIDMVVGYLDVDALSLLKSVSSFDTLRIGILDNEKTNDEVMNKVLSVIRPLEFSTTFEPSFRYLTDHTEIFRKHADSYIINTGLSHNDSLRVLFNKCEVDENSEDALISMLSKPVDRKEDLLKCINIGSGFSFSGKIARLLEIVYSRKEDSTVYCVTSSLRTKSYVSEITKELDVKNLIIIDDFFYKYKFKENDIIFVFDETNLSNFYHNLVNEPSQTIIFNNTYLRKAKRSLLEMLPNDEIFLAV